MFKYFKNPSDHSLGATAILILTTVLAGNSLNAAAEGKGARQGRNAELAGIRAATNQYMKVEAALDAGYISSVDLGAGCSTAEGEGHPKQLGAMGIHFVKLDNFGSPDFDFREPSVLVYLPDPDIEHCAYTTDELLADKACRDGLSLAAVEEVVFAHLIDTENGGNYWDHVPTFMGKQFYYLHDNPETPWVDEAHGFPPHYALHIWLFDHNPAGLFSPWNPNVKCPASLGHH